MDVAAVMAAAVEAVMAAAVEAGPSTFEFLCLMASSTDHLLTCNRIFDSDGVIWNERLE